MSDLRSDHTTTGRRPKTACPPDMCKGGRRSFGTAILGLGVLAVGLLLTLDNLRVLDASDFLPYWPVLLIFLGVSRLLQPRGSRCLVSGLIWIGVGATLLFYNLDLIDFDVWDLWPVLLVIFGANLLWGAIVGRRRRRRSAGSSASDFSAVALLGSQARHIGSQEFVGGEATAIMGGCDIDLRDAAIADPPAEISVYAFWGGVEIKVPEGWRIDIRGAAILGAMEDHTRERVTDSDQVLVIRGLALMGGVEVKN